MAYKLLHRVTRAVTADGQWSARFVYILPNGEADATAEAFRGVELAAYSSPLYKSVAARIVAEKGYFSGKHARLTVYFQAFRKPNTARLRGLTRSQAKRALVDLDGNTIQGQDRDGLHFWKPTGQNLVNDGIEVMLVQACYESLPDPLIGARAWIGKVNSDPLTNCGIPIGVWRLWNYRYWPVDPLGYWYFDYEFHCSPYRNEQGIVPWNDGLKSEKGQYVVKRSAVLEITGYNKNTGLPETEFTGQFAKQNVWLPGEIGGEDPVVEDRRLYETVAMSALDSIVVL